MEVMKYSDRLGEISEEQLQQALDRFSLGKFVEATPIKEGLFGQNLFLTSDKGDFVLRGVPHYPWQFKSERFFAKLLHERTAAPVPWPYLLDKSKDIFGWEYVIMPKLSGLQLLGNKAGEPFADVDWVEIARAQGRMLGEIQKLTWECPGQYNEANNKIKPLELPFADWVAEGIMERLTKAQVYNDKTTAKDLQWAQGLLTKAKGALKAKFQPCFVMQDYKLGNMVFGKVSSRWEVTGLFDLMESYFGNGGADVSRTFCDYTENNKPELAYSFLNEYLRSEGKREGFEERFPAFILLDRTIIWEWTQRSSRVWWDKALTFKQWAEPFTRLDETRID